MPDYKEISQGMVEGFLPDKERQGNQDKAQDEHTQLQI